MFLKSWYKTVSSKWQLHHLPVPSFVCFWIWSHLCFTVLTSSFLRVLQINPHWHHPLKAVAVASVVHSVLVTSISHCLTEFPSSGTWLWNVRGLLPNPICCCVEISALCCFCFVICVLSLVAQHAPGHAASCFSEQFVANSVSFCACHFHFAGTLMETSLNPLINAWRITFGNK